MLAQALVFNKFHRLLAEVSPAVEMANWRLNDVGMARISLAMTDQKCTPDILKPGNRLLLLWDNGLPLWGGVLGLPRRRERGRVTMTAYTAEALADWRVTAKGRYFDAQSPGYIFQTLLEDENDEEPTGLTVGSIYTGGTPRTLEYHYHDLLARWQDLARLTGEDFAVAPAYTAGVLTFAANWYQKRGDDNRTKIWLEEGQNVSNAILDEQGPLANRVIVVGEGSTWAADRQDSIAVDLDSQNTYGYREYSEVQSGVVEQTTLDANAAALLAEKKDPYNALTLSAANVPPATFGDYDIGDIVTVASFVDAPLWYFERPVRIVAREWQPGGACRLEVVEWQGS